MNTKTIVGILVLAVLVGGWFFFQGSTVNYVAEVNDEVAALESELAEIEAAVQAGTLTPEEAAEAQTKIVARIDAINNSASAGQKAKLTDAQRVQLIDGLERLKQTLIKYKATLVAVDEAVLELPEAERPKLNRRGGGGRRSSVAAIATETVEDIEEQVEEIIEDITDEEIAAEVATSSTDEMSDETETGTSTEEVISDDSSTSTDDVSEDTTSGEEESTDGAGESETENTEDETSEEDPEPDADVSVAAEGDVTVNETEEEETTNQ